MKHRIDGFPILATGQATGYRPLQISEFDFEQDTRNLTTTTAYANDQAVLEKKKIQLNSKVVLHHRPNLLSSTHPTTQAPPRRRQFQQNHPALLNVVVTMSSHEPSTVQVTLNSIHAISFWTWSSEDDVCAICQNPLDGCAEGCEFPGDDSPVVWGECQHAFHLRCLQQWLQTNNSCPICRRDWKYSSDENKTDAAKAAAAAAAAAAAVPDTATVPAADIVAIATAAAAAAMADT